MPEEKREPQGKGQNNNSPGDRGDGGSAKKKNNRRRRNRNRYKKTAPPEPSVAASSPVYTCPLCEQDIKDILTAISITSEKTPAHFDCVLRQIAQTEEIQNREKVVYLGKGEFGIVKFKGGNSSGFTVRKRIPFEQIEGGIPWRREISKKLKR